MKKERKTNNLLLLRILHGNLDQNYIAFKLGISQPAYSKIESGENEPSQIMIQKLSLLYECDVSEIIFIDIEELKLRLFNHSNIINPTLSEKIDIKMDRTKRRFKVFINRMKILSVY